MDQYGTDLVNRRLRRDNLKEKVPARQATPLRAMPGSHSKEEWVLIHRPNLL